LCHQTEKMMRMKMRIQKITSLQVDSYFGPNYPAL
jgi:hypothetical protein